MRCKTFIEAEIIALVAILSLSAGCVGISSGSGNPDILVRTGYFVDAPVEGLYYETATRWGFTGADGAFEYQSGERVSFYVGDILLGSAAGAYEITPFDLAGMNPPETNIEIVRARNRIDRSQAATPFEIALNIALFLQSLDGDGDPGNGILIPDTIDTMALERSLDFSQDPWEFRDDFSFRKLMADGRDAGVWGGTRAIRSPLHALDSLYDGLGIAPQIYAPSVFETDTDGDQNPDWRETYTYDTYGNLIRYEHDSNMDSHPDEIGTYSYNANGAQTGWAWDSDGDGAPEERKIYTYDANGNQTKYEEDSDGDGDIDWITQYTYSSSGNLLSEVTDYNNDGTYDWRSTYTYDASGNKTLYEYDGNGDSIVDQTTEYIYDTNGDLIESLRDTDGDLIGDEHTVYEYDQDGNLALSQWDYDYDGNPDEIEVYDGGYLVEVYYDNDDNGSADEIHSYYYDQSGNLVAYEEDYDADNQPDYVEEGTYNPDGNLTSVAYDFDANGSVDELISYTYDNLGNLLVYREDWGNNGSIDYRENISYISTNRFKSLLFW